MENISLMDLKKVLYDESSFSQFINKSGLFASIKTEDYVEILNNYMNLILSFDFSEVPKEVFDHINKINSKFSFKQFYNYHNSMDGHGKTVSADMVESILINDDVFKKFMDFSNYKDFFGNISLESYLRKIKFYLKFALEHKLPVDAKIGQNFKQISFKYADFLPSKDKLVGEIPTGEIDPEFEKYILSSIDFSKSKFSVALQIYIKLLQSTIYNATFIANKIDMKDNTIKNIYFQNVKEVNLKNNKTICTGNSKLYALFLMKCGFKARIIREFHSYTIFECDGELIKADPSVLLMDSNGFSLLDFTRAKMNLPVAGFSYFSGEGDVSEKVEKAYQELNIYPTFKLEIINLLNQGVEKKSFEERLEILNEKSKQTKLIDLDYVGYISSLLKSIFSVTELLNINIYNVYIKSPNSYHVGLIISRDTENGIEYYLAHNVIGVAQIGEEQLSNMLKEGSFIINKKDERITRLENITVGSPKM